MKKLIGLLLFTIVIASCERTDDNGKAVVLGPNVLTVEGCKYVVYRSSNGGVAMVHAGNCPNHK